MDAGKTSQICQITFENVHGTVQNISTCSTQKEAPQFFRTMFVLSRHNLVQQNKKDDI